MMQTKPTPERFTYISPAGAEARLLLDNQYGEINHCTLKAEVISKPVRHKTVSEFWYVLSGKGKIWRKNNNTEEITTLTTGISIDTPSGTDFQYRSDEEDLVFICVTMPPWIGPDEAEYAKEGAWEPTANTLLK